MTPDDMQEERRSLAHALGESLAWLQEAAYSTANLIDAGDDAPLLAAASAALLDAITIIERIRRPVRGGWFQGEVYGNER